MDIGRQEDLSSISPASAAALAAKLLGSVGTRLAHSAAVADRARFAEGAVRPEDRSLLVVAAWLHDIGYSVNLAATGFHPLDGARFLSDRGAAPRLVNLVANHSCARFEASQRNLRRELAEFAKEDSPLADALIYADMTTSPVGEAVGVEDRLAEILRRYKAEDPVHRAVEEASFEIRTAVSRVEQRLAQLL